MVFASGACKEISSEEPHAKVEFKGWLTRALLRLSDSGEPGEHRTAASRVAALQRLRELTVKAQDALARAPHAHPVDLLNHLLFTEEKLKRVVKNPPLKSMRLTHVLSRGEGSCLGLSGLYLALGEQLGLPLSGVLVPGHFFVRYRGPQGDRPIELLRQGEQMPSSWYRRKYGVPAGNPLYLRDLSPRQTLAVFRYNQANAHREGGRYREAIKIYQQVVTELPQFAEAQANLGLCHQRLGRVFAARQAYERARAAHPGLPGLAQNLEALDSLTGKEGVGKEGAGKERPLSRGISDR